jgi:hypothetical protein
VADFSRDSDFEEFLYLIRSETKGWFCNIKLENSWIGRTKSKRYFFLSPIRPALYEEVLIRHQCACSIPETPTPPYFITHEAS